MVEALDYVRTSAPVLVHAHVPLLGTTRGRQE